MEHEHPRGVDTAWYHEHLEQEHYTVVDPSFSRATTLSIHRRCHEDDDAREEAHKVAPFNDRRPRQVAVVERQRPVRTFNGNGEVPVQVDD